MNSGVGEYWHSLILLIWVCLLQLNCLWKCCSCCLFFYIWLLFHCDHLLPSPSPISNGSINCIEFVLHLLSYMQNLSYHLFALLWLLTSGIPPTLWPTQSCSQTLQQCCHQWPFLMIYKTCPAHLICHKCKFRKKEILQLSTLSPVHHQWCVQLYANDYATKCPEGYGHVIICALCVNKALIWWDKYIEWLFLGKLTRDTQF